MLVLSRKSGQSIQIGDNITIRITRVGGNQVRLGIEAPMEVAIRRGELQLNHAESSDSTAATDSRSSTEIDCVAESKNRPSQRRALPSKAARVSPRTTIVPPLSAETDAGPLSQWLGQ